MKGHLTALYHEVGDAGRAIEDLISAGVYRDEISMLTTEGRASHFGVRKASKAPEGAVAGGLLGGALGAIGASLGTAATAGVGILATGPILMGLAGLGTGAAVGGLAGALAGLGIPEHEAKFYEREIRDRNAILIGVATQRHDRDDIAEILSRHNPAKMTENA